ncbi:MAG TPA: hypothetical protein VNK95_01745 [Caldilineaceae bacterium]|nr:hypothetical protein [Caldilineaceae bacterium]
MLAIADILQQLEEPLQWLLVMLALLGPLGFVAGMAALALTRRADLRERDEKLYAALERTDMTLVQVYQTLQSVNRVLSDILQERREFHRDLMDYYRELRAKDMELEALRQRVSENEGTVSDDLPVTPLLLICGDEQFCRDDASQLNRAKVWFRLLERATKASVEDELQRRRHNDDLYPWLLVSAHGSPAGIVLADGLADRNWWNRQLEGIRVVMLANCEGPATGDVLAGLVDYVVVLYGERATHEVSNFVYSFWAEMVRHRDARRAYRQAIQDVPQIRPYADLRMR